VVHVRGLSDTTFVIENAYYFGHLILSRLLAGCSACGALYDRHSRAMQAMFDGCARISAIHVAGATLGRLVRRVWSSLGLARPSMAGFQYPVDRGPTNAERLGDLRGAPRPWDFISRTWVASIEAGRPL
jgi:hypothetical protein